MRHILAGLTLAGMLTLGTLAAFAADDTIDVPSMPIDKTAPSLHNDLQAADANVAVPFIVEKRGENMGSQEHDAEID